MTANPNISVLVRKPFNIKATKPVETIINPLTLRTNPLVAISGKLSSLNDVVMANPSNNSVLIYNSATQEFVLDQLSLSGGEF